MRSDVYFIKAEGKSLEQKADVLKKILKRLNYFQELAKDELVPVKITIGDSACVYNLEPELVKIVILEIKDKKAKPFIFDTSVIYSGQRQNAVDHLNLAQSKGFGHTRVGAPFVIADGVLGLDGREFNFAKESLIEKIKVPSFVGMLDSLVVLSHPTGHIVAGYGGAIKNVAMGMSCRATKQVQHSSLRPNVIEKKCVACGCCKEICPVGAVILNKTAFIDQKKCLGCGECLCACKFDAIFINWHEDPQVFSKRMAEAANFILSKFKNKFFINFAFNVTKECDCISNKDEPMVSPDFGILASRDILSLDKATIDLLEEKGDADFFNKHNKTYQTLFDHASSLGMGNLEYNLIEI